jgi:catechol 2,3-dioxygenase-like lactoylglutathione lyase family enzyme
MVMALAPLVMPVRHHTATHFSAAYTDRGSPAALSDGTAAENVIPASYRRAMDWKIELIPVPVTDVDRAKTFYQSVGFNADHDHTVHEGLRFVQLTPPGSACSIVIGEGVTGKTPGTQEIQVVVADAGAARRQLLDAGVEASEIDVQPWGKFVYFRDPDGNRWSLQAIESRPNG